MIELCLGVAMIMYIVCELVKHFEWYTFRDFISPEKKIAILLSVEKLSVFALN